jgi:uncharacterized membrane protein YcaP (DUF421 family)
MASPLRILLLADRAATESTKKGTNIAKSIIPMALILIFFVSIWGLQIHLEIVVNMIYGTARKLI